MEINLDFGFWSFLVGMSWAIPFFLFAFFIPYKKYFVAKKYMTHSLTIVVFLTLLNAFGILLYSVINDYSSGVFAGFFLTLLATLLTYVILRFILRTKRLKKQSEGFGNVMSETANDKGYEITTENIYCTTLILNLLFMIAIFALSINFVNDHLMIYQGNDNRIILSEFDENSDAKCGTQFKDRCELYFFEKNRVGVKTLKVQDFKATKKNMEELARNKKLPFTYISLEEAQEFFK